MPQSKKFGLPRWLSGKAFACNARDLGSVPGLGRSPGEGNRNPLLYSCLGNPIDSGTWRATVHGVAESDMTELLSTSNHNTYTTVVCIFDWETILASSCFLYFLVILIGNYFLCLYKMCFYKMVWVPRIQNWLKQFWIIWTLLNKVEFIFFEQIFNKVPTFQVV